MSLVSTLYKLITRRFWKYTDNEISSKPEMTLEMKMINELLDYILLISYVIMKQNKDILISFSKLDEVCVLDTSYHKKMLSHRDLLRNDTLFSTSYVRPNTTLIKK